LSPASFFFFFIATAPTDIYTLSLHDALPILHRVSLERGEDHLLRRAGDAVPHRHPLKVATIQLGRAHRPRAVDGHRQPHPASAEDRKSTRLNSSHVKISYAVFCLKKKKTRNT